MQTTSSTPLERRLEGAKTGFPLNKSAEGNGTWDIPQLRQSLKDDSTALENSLREANKLMETPKEKGRARFQTGTAAVGSKTFLTSLEGAVEEAAVTAVDCNVASAGRGGHETASGECAGRNEQSVQDSASDGERRAEKDRAGRPPTPCDTLAQRGRALTQVVLLAGAGGVRPAAALR
eukprot:1658143-Rhodomonas_salina.2